MRALAEVYGRGATKYEDHNWARGYPLGLSLDAAMRHLEAFRSGETYDPESGQHHLAHLAWHAFTGYIFTTDPAYAEFDDRADRYNQRPG